MNRRRRTFSSGRRSFVPGAAISRYFLTDTFDSLFQSDEQQGVLLGIPASGKSLRFTSCDIFRVADGKIAEHWGMGDIAGVLAQIKG